MSEHEEAASDSVSTSRSRLRPGKNPATIGAIATVLAAVIAGVFTLIASHGSAPYDGIFRGGNASVEVDYNSFSGRRSVFGSGRWRKRCVSC